MADPAMADFVNALEPVNERADTAPGFVWRLQSSPGEDPQLDAFEADGWLFNLSIWRSFEELSQFVRSGDHLAMMRRRREWFEPRRHSLCLWWVPAGHYPDFAEARDRLDSLKCNGPSPGAFDFRQAFAPPTGEAGV